MGEKGEKKAVAVMTWQLSNYGTALQAFALNLYIRNMGYSCDLVNYSLEYKNLVHVDKPSTVQCNFQYLSAGLKRVVARKKKRFLNGYTKKLEKKYFTQIELSKERFAQFYSSIPHVGKKRYEKKDLSKLTSQYACFICGSDQIWNPKYLDGAYFLDFVGDSAKRISYAPSIGVTTLTEEERAYMIPLIQSLDAVSVRETQVCRLLKQYGVGQLTVVLDPTLLLERREWDKNIPFHPCISTRKKIVFVYFLENNFWYQKVVSNLKKKFPDALWVTIPKTIISYSSRLFDQKFPDAGPIEFVNLIRQSAFLLTDSYHGVCFAIKYHKEFVALQRFQQNTKGSENSRIESLLGLLEIENRFFDKEKASSLDFGEIDWGKAEKKLEEQVFLSRNFLEESIGEGR